MTYLELLERADYLLEKGEITIGEWEDMIAPLRKEIAPYGDLIYRQDALDALGEEPEVWFDKDYEIAQRDQWRMDRNAIESVSAWSGWIPCSERLPEDVEIEQEYPTVIYSTSSGEVAAGWYEVLAKTWWRESVYDDVIKDKVIAWMPLPEPYRGE